MPTIASIDDLLLSWQERRERGDSCTPEELCRHCPQLLPELQKRVQELESMLNWMGDTAGFAHDTVPPQPDTLPAIPGYDVLAELGRGGMGIVYKVRQHGLNRLAVLKMIRTSGLPNAEALKRLQIEAEAVAKLKHPNVVEVYSFGNHGGQPFIVMEYLEGGNLDQLLRQRRWSPREAAALVASLADAVEHAHRQGILHRDIKPANILFDKDGTPHLADFGLARSAESTASLTLAGTPLGTPAYMAPEQARGSQEDLGPATDVFGLGAVLYQLLTQRAPFSGGNLAAVLQQATAGRVTPPRAVDPNVPAALERICLQALAADPRQRHASAAMLAHDLRRFVQRPKRVAFIAALAAAVLIVIGLGAPIVFSPPRRRPDPPPTAAAAPPLDDRLTVLIWSPDSSKQGLRLGVDPGALPARSGDQIRADIRLNQPAYIYLLLVDSEGTVVPLYPWHSDTKRLNKTLADPPPIVSPRSELLWPSLGDRLGLTLDDTVGQETLLLLVSKNPIPASTDLVQIFGKPPLAPLEQAGTFVVRGGPAEGIRVDHHRGFGPGYDPRRGVKKELEEIDDELDKLLARLQPHFDLVRAVRFAHVGK